MGWCRFFVNSSFRRMTRRQGTPRLPRESCGTTLGTDAEVVGEAVSMRLLLCDDQELFRTGLRRVLEAYDDIEVAGETSDGAECVAAARALRPDVVLMEVRVPTIDGIEATRRLLEDGGSQPTSVVMLTVADREQDALAALRAGASGYLLKDTDPDTLVGAIRAVVSGGTALAPSVARCVLDHLAPTSADDEGRQAALLARLTARESDLLRLLAKGHTNAQIAERLFLSEGTVRTYVSRMLRKLEARDRTMAVVMAFDAGVVHPRRGQPAGPWS